MMTNYNTKGKWCVLAGRKCPGRNVEAKLWGCPHWCTVTVVEGGETQTHTGCGVLMLPSIQLSTSKSANRVAASVQSNRNEMVQHLDEGFEMVAKVVAIGQQEIRKAITDGSSEERDKHNEESV